MGRFCFFVVDRIRIEFTLTSNIKSSLFKNAFHDYTLLNLSPSFVPFLAVSLSLTFIQKTRSKIWGYHLRVKESCTFFVWKPAEISLVDKRILFSSLMHERSDAFAKTQRNNALATQHHSRSNVTTKKKKKRKISKPS